MPLSWNEIRDRAFADLYDPLTMPPEVHQSLDRVLDATYGVTGFKSEAERAEFLFERYQELVAPLMPVKRKGRKISGAACAGASGV